MSTGNNNDIDNGNFLSENINVNENNVGNNGRKKKYERSKAVDIIALDLAEKLQSPNSYEFYCKIAWRLQPSVIYNNLEQALKSKRRNANDSPARLFGYLCNKCLGE